jgi:DNA-binding response OmpR family regulator
VSLTTTEFDLLHTLAASAGRVLSREQLMDRVYGAEWQAYDRSIDVHISRIRHKIGDDPRRPRLLKTVRGIGYQLARLEES